MERLFCEKVANPNMLHIFTPICLKFKFQIQPLVDGCMKMGKKASFILLMHVLSKCVWTGWWKIIHHRMRKKWWCHMPAQDKLPWQYLRRWDLDFTSDLKHSIPDCCNYNSDITGFHIFPSLSDVMLCYSTQKWLWAFNDLKIFFEFY